MATVVLAYNSSIYFISFSLKEALRAMSLNATIDNNQKNNPAKLAM
jgi:hypothetical protein